MDRSNPDPRGWLGSSGTLPLTDGTEIDWYYWQGERPAIQSYAPIGGYIATLYRGELYDVQSHHSLYRSFGITDGAVHRLVWLIIRPAEADGRHGVYPRSDRNSLLMAGGEHAGGPLPILEWASEFSRNLPDPILTALSEAHSADSNGSLDDSWKQRLAERFGDRWRIFRRRLSPAGKHTTDPGHPRSGNQAPAQPTATATTS